MARATRGGECWVCESRFEKGDHIVLKRGNWVHAHCAYAGDE